MSTPDIAVRFRSKHGDGDGCWVWAGRKNRRGYGLFTIGHAASHLAHRVSFQIHHGPIPDGLHVLHRCDNPACVNPAHLFLGTHTDNMRDMATKGRGVYPEVRGERNPMARLTEVQVADIRARYVPRRTTLASLANKHGVSISAVSMIVNRKRWP